MNEVAKAFYEKVVAPALQQRQANVRAVVTEYDEKTSLATIEFPSPHGEEMTVIEQVPVQIGSGGVHSAGPFVGDDVWVSFVNNNILQPQVVALVDRDYKEFTRERRIKHTKKGAFVPDAICNRR